MNSGVLYISYDGILEPLGQSQVLRYLQRLARDHEIVLISFEKPQDWQQIESREALRAAVRAGGITWIPLRYHKWPSALATMFDIAQGVIVGSWVVTRHRICIVHARSYVPSVIALAFKKLFGVKYIFDMRGFWADERVDGGLWPAGGRLYRVAKWFERQFLLNADCVVSLTETALDEMRTFPYLAQRMPRFEQITTCADLELFRPGERVPECHPPDRPFTLGYVGSVGLWYLFEETLRCFQLLLERVPDARLRIINRGGHDYIRERLGALNVDPASVQLEAADHSGVASAMREMDAGVFIIRPLYSKIASAPTKLGEFLGCGVPCLGNSGVGDMASILENEHVGVALSSFDEAAMREAIDRLLQLTQTPGIKVRCRAVALRYFSLDRGVMSYNKIYRELSGERP
jgi:glycosyltransferase involved in cell wall biosynthesis